MKILSLSNKMPFPPKDGGTIGIFNVINSLANVGNEVYVLAINTPKHFIKDDEIPQDIRQKLHIESVFINTNLSLVHLLKNLFFSEIPYIAARFYSKEYEDKLILMLRENKFDLVQIEGLYMCTYIDVIRKYSDAKISLRSHNIEHEIWKRTAANESNPVKRMYLKHMSNRILKLKKNIINKYDVLVPVTERDENVFLRLGNKKASLALPAGIDIEDYRLIEDSAVSPSLFHLGALDWVPNQEGLHWFVDQCWPIIRASRPGLNFHIAGRNAPAWFVKKIDKEGIVFHGEVPDAKEFISKYAIMVVPLLSGSGMRIKIIEGMSLGKTIVTTPIGTEGIPTTHHENILIADNEYSFAKEIDKILEDEELLKKISINAIDFVRENYDNNGLALKLTEFYKNCCK